MGEALPNSGQTAYSKDFTMSRPLLGAALTMMLVAPIPALAQDQEQTCIDTSNIVSTIITMRADGTDANTIKQTMTTGDGAVSERYLATVQPLVDWVFTIEEAVVSEPAAPEMIAAEYRKTCVGYQP